MSQAYGTIKNIIGEKTFTQNVPWVTAFKVNLYPQVTGFMQAFSYKFFSL